MTQEEKQLLLKDLCMRIPYRTFVCLNPGAYNKPETCILTGVHGEQVHLNVDSDPFRIDHIKPYLRPMSSMTEEEVKEIQKINWQFYKPENGLIECFVGDADDGYCSVSQMTGILDYLNAHHFDYRGLIEKGLAIDCTNLNIY